MSFSDNKAELSVALPAQTSVTENERVSSERAVIWKGEGNSRLVAGDLAGALNCYDRGIEAAKDASLAGKILSQLHTNRAQVQLRLGRYAEALQDCEAAVANDPSNGKAYWRGATAAMRLDMAGAAAAICLRGIKAVGDSDGLSILLEEARAKQQTEHAQPTASQELAERAASLLQTYRQADCNSRKVQDVRSAICLFQASLQEEPQNEVALLGLGEILDDGLGEAPKDPFAARQLWLQAAKAGSQRAEMKLCVQALELFALSARQTALPDQNPSPSQARPEEAGT